MSGTIALPERVLKIVRRLQSGEVLVKTFVDTVDSHEPRYSLHPSGAPLPTLSSEEAIASGLLKQSRDGLFDDSQTWRWGGASVRVVRATAGDLLTGAVA